MKLQTTSFGITRREAETRLRIPGARLSSNVLLSYEENCESKVDYVSPGVGRGLANLTPSYVRGMNQASACKRISDPAVRVIAIPLQGLLQHVSHVMDDV